MIFETERLIIRPWKIDDAKNLYEYAKDPEVGPSAGWQPHKNINESEFVIINFLNGTQCYAICLKHDKKPIGCIELILHLNKPYMKDNECELGFWIGKPFWGKGYIPEAAKKLITYGFKNLNIKTIWCCHNIKNTKSKRAQEKIGFIQHHTEINKSSAFPNEKNITQVNYIKKENWTNFN